MLLVLSRKQNEKLIIDDNIRVTIISVHGNRVRLGIEAPDWVGVDRAELIAEGDAAESVDPLKARPFRDDSALGVAALG